MGTGLISSDFVGALKALPAEEAVVVAVGARSMHAAQSFADSFGVTRAYEGYEAVAADPDVDVIYVGTVAQTHVSCARIALAGGKPVLVEKPLAMCASDASALVEEARRKHLFLMEGMWTRCFPAIAKVRELLECGVIGDVVSCSADFGWPANPHAEHRRTIDPTSGGVSLDVAMYPLSHVLLAGGASLPTRVCATGTTRKASDGASRVDWSVGAALSGFAHNPSLTATITCTLDASTPEEVIFSGTKGTLRIHRAAHTPSKLTLSVAHSRELSTETELLFDLPPIPDGALPLNYPGSQGFVYEASAVHDALRAGLLECREWTHEESVTCQAIVDQIRATVIREGVPAD